MYKYLKSCNLKWLLDASFTGTPIALILVGYSKNLETICRWKKMAQKNARVTNVNTEGWAEVLVERGDACNNCESSQFCHALSDCSKLKTTVRNQAGAKPGDLVTIQMNTQKVFKAAVILYLVPIAGMLAGAIAGNGFSSGLGIEQTFATIIFAFAGLGFGFLVPVAFSRRISANKRLTPVITRIIKNGEHSLIGRNLQE